jgi:hypothetical protein
MGKKEGLDKYCLKINPDLSTNYEENRKYSRVKLKKQGKNINEEAIRINLLEYTGCLGDWSGIITYARDFYKKRAFLSE